MKSSLLLLALLLSSSPLSAQVIRPAGQHQADKAESQFDKGIPPPVRQRQSADPAKLREDASELETWHNPFHRQWTKPRRESCLKTWIRNSSELKNLPKSCGRGSITENRFRPTIADANAR